MIVVGLASAALAGQVFLEPVALDEVIARSQVIVYATIADPPTAPTSRSTGEGCEPWSTVRYNVIVEKVLRNTPDGPAAHDRLAALPGYTSEMVELAERECTEGSRKSPIHSSYGGRVEWIAGATVVLFLRWDDPNGWELTVEDAWEPGKKLKKVEKLLGPAADAG